MHEGRQEAFLAGASGVVGGGLSRAPSSASMRASTWSVFPMTPMARAKSRACRGLTRLNGLAPLRALLEVFGHIREALRVLCARTEYVWTLAVASLGRPSRKPR